MELRDQSTTAPSREVEKDSAPAAEAIEASTDNQDVTTDNTVNVEPLIKKAPRPETPQADAETPHADGADASEADDIDNAAVYYKSKVEVLDAMRELSAKAPEEITTEATARLKHLFYNFRNAEIKAEKATFAEAGGDIDTFTPAEDPAEETFKDLLNLIKDKKAEMRTRQEAQRKDNLDRKEAIINAVLEMSDDTDNVNRHFQRVKELQTEFKAIGEVPPTNAADVWKRYQDAVERFYDQLKINKELRDYDFRKNLAEKQLLVDEAEKLADEADVITAFRRLQALHDKWRETGPVAKELREEIWARFKNASAAVNKRYQAFFEERKSIERDNEEAKIAICVRVEAIEFDNVKSYKTWDELTRVMLQAQDDWKKLGFASRKVNNELFARFRATCDRFFAAKSAYFKSMKEEMTLNLEKKTALCEKAEALKDSTDWRETTEALLALQAEWKTIGTVPRKHSDTVWKRFIAACDHFFDEKKKATSGTRKAEQANLKAKLEIIAQLKAIPDDAKRDDILQTIRDSRTRWQEIGHVPFKEKDKIYDRFRTAINDLYDKHDIRETRARFNAFENNINTLAEDGDDNKLYRERERLMRAYESRKAELQTYENNLGFFSSKSKAGDSMLRDLERKIDRIKEDLDTLRKKIEVIDSKL